MMNQAQRRRTPYPWTWEPPVLVLLAVGTAVTVAAQTARAAANLLAGNGWLWGDTGVLLINLPALVRGDAAAGLEQVAHPAGPLLLRVCLVVAELVAAAVLVAAGRAWWSRRGGAVKGVATREQLADHMGARRLAESAALLRPDLVPPGSRVVVRPSGRRWWWPLRRQQDRTGSR